MRRVFLLFVAFLVFLTPTNAHAQDRNYGSITLYKESSTFDSPGQSLAGIEFQLNRLSDIDIMTEEGRQSLASLSVEQVLRGEVPIDAPLTQRTTAEGDRGVARFTDLPLGAYLVQENPTRTGDVSRSVSAPFFVSLPYTSVDGLHYDVAGKPKTQPVTIVKSADTETLRRGQIFNYILDSSVPAPDTAGQLHRYVINDTIPEGLSFNNRHSIEMRAHDYSTTLAEGTHYNLEVIDRRAITVRFTTEGLAELARARTEHFDLTVHFTFNVRAVNNLENGTVLINIAYLYPDGYPEPGEFDASFSQENARNIPSNEVILTVNNDRPGPVIPGFPTFPTRPTSPTPTEQIPGVTPSRPSPTSPTEQTTGVQPGGGSGQQRGPLASTGANVIAAIVLGLILAAIGVFLIWRRPSDER
ncbi:SpaH/EbpB family LPXTG-anchored major pilin [Corynebacterium glutamicum]|uniref:SpaH/EbpB family LPXTG-anchored major pilin n=1 Tax=Corynebacterium glutamicum TaxID=1718 RepID=UPI000744D4BD|nr:SpaH/EbpB family LPXTG-anchored major pilin [Corynebacterium glutamicum]AMA01293.1 hypothetical protein APT58_14215 [Corynebacterium glutamicum]